MDDYEDHETDEEEILEMALRDFKRASECEDENRKEALDDLKFSRMGEQWPDEVKQSRKLEGRPCMTFNRMPVYIRQVVNDSRLNRPAIKVHPVDSGSDPQTAEILDGLIRNIEVSSNADVAYDTAIDQAVSSGFGYFRINIDYACDDTFDLDIMIERVANQFTVYGDPNSTSADSSDWDTAFVTEMVTREEFMERFPKAEPKNWEGDHDEKSSEWYEEGKLRLAEYWVRKKVKRLIHRMQDGAIVDDDRLRAMMDEAIQQGVPYEMVEMVIAPVDSRDTYGYEVTQYLLTGAQVLETNKWPGRFIPIVPVYGDEVIVEGKRYFRSLIRDAKDPQRSYNYWRTSAVEKVALDSKAPWIGPEGTFSGAKDAQKWSTSNVKNHPYLEYKPVNGPAPARQYGGGVPAGDMAMTAAASDDMKATIGIYDASLGARSNETSGVAIRQRQREGDVSTFHFIDNLSRAIRHAGRILVDLIPKVYNTERVIRVLGEDRRPKEMIPGQPPGQVPVNQPVMIEGVERIFDITTGKYDVTVETGPAFSTRREEAAAQMTEMIRANPALMQIAGDLLVKNYDWPGADDLAKRIENMVPPQAKGQQPQQGPSPEQAQQMQQAMQQMQSKLQQLAQENQALKLQMQDKSQQNAIAAQEAQIKAQQAETDRFKALVEASKPPEQPRAVQITGQEPVF